jgi:hypothetical protein
MARMRAHPTKTKLVPVCPQSAMAKGQNGSEDGRPRMFNLLGFTCYCGQSIRLVPMALEHSRKRSNEPNSKEGLDLFPHSRCR